MTERGRIEKVFVYGTLRRGQRYYPQIADWVESAEPATAKGILYHLPDGYPAMVPGEGTVQGELLTLRDSEAAIAVMDQIEGYDGAGKENEYVRITGTAMTKNGCCSCQMYIYPQERKVWLARCAHWIPEGDWVQWIEKNCGR
jgi:gamma-glutamylcyclotransferase (GGCT)/AIG2-like uncharacterized protein YtfP